jgi:ABC-type nitrate/sulfonate/bicarbonate transport system permease component
MITIGVIGLLLDKCIGFFEKWVAKNWGFGSVSNTREG